MKHIWKLAGIAALVVVLGVTAVGAVAYAQEQGEGFPFDFHERFRQAIAEILNITPEEYDAAVEQAHEQVADQAVTEGWLTEEQAERMQERKAEGFGRRGMGKGFAAPPMGPRGQGRDSLISVAAEALGLSVEDLVAELRDGKSIADLASAKGVNVQDIADAHLEQVKENLDQAVADGKLTQERAEWMLEQAGEQVLDQLNNTWEGRFPGRFPGGGRPGPMRGFPGQDDA
jgi:polyhydroxyalkanoate synthesis regulator phasin